MTRTETVVIEVSAAEVEAALRKVYGLSEKFKAEFKWKAGGPTSTPRMRLILTATNTATNTETQ
jgi:hypothetical protein